MGDEILGRALATFIAELTGYTPSLELCRLMAYFIFAEAEEHGRELLVELKT